MRQSNRSPAPLTGHSEPTHAYGIRYNKKNIIIHLNEAETNTSHDAIKRSTEFIAQSQLKTFVVLLFGID